jgi:hypothetical protein
LIIDFLNPLNQINMSNTWFAGEFCPNKATCSLEDGALTPSNGPKIRTLVLSEPRDNPLVATVQAFADENIDPTKWAKCNGQLIPIHKHSGLYTLLVTRYGGDGRTTFGLPDLSGEGNGDYYICLEASITD